MDQILGPTRALLATASTATKETTATSKQLAEEILKELIDVEQRKK